MVTLHTYFATKFVDVKIIMWPLLRSPRTSRTFRTASFLFSLLLPCILLFTYSFILTSTYTTHLVVPFLRSNFFVHVNTYLAFRFVCVNSTFFTYARHFIILYCSLLTHVWKYYSHTCTSSLSWTSSIVLLYVLLLPSVCMIFTCFQY